MIISCFREDVFSDLKNRPIIGISDTIGHLLTVTASSSDTTPVRTSVSPSFTRTVPVSNTLD